MNYLINDYFNMKTIIKQAQDSYLIEDPIKRAERWIEENPLLTYLLFEWGK